MHAVLLLLMLFADAPPGANLSGKAVGPDGAPASGVTVCIYSATPKKGNAALHPREYPDCAKSALTDANGDFTISRVDPSLNFELLVLSEQFRPLLLKKVDPGRGEVTAKLKAMPTDVEADLLVKGRLIDAAGAPIAAAKIEVNAFGNANMRQFGGESGVIESNTYSNAKGEFVLIAKKTGNDFDLLVHARSVAPTILRHVVPGETVNEYSLGAGAVITGRAVKDGQPLAGVKLVLLQQSHNSETWLGPDSAITDETGKFTFPHVAASTAFDLSGTMKSLGGRGASPVTHCTSTGDETTLDLGDIAVEAGFSIAGQLVTAEGKPVGEGSKVQLSGDATWGEIVETPVDKEGKFEFKCAPADLYTLTPKVDGYHLSKENVSADHYGNGPRMLMGRVDDNVTDLKIQFDPGPAETGRGDNNSSWYQTLHTSRLERR